MSDQPVTPETTKTNESIHESLFSKINLKLGVVLIILISLLLVAASYWLYVSSERYKYDLARPDVEREVTVNIDESTLDRESPIDAAAVKKMQKLLNDQEQSLAGLNDYSSRALSDEALQVNTTEE